MPIDLTIPLSDMVLCMSSAVDLVSSDLVGHHNRVAYIAYEISREIGLSREDQIDILLAGALHDTGALNLKERIDILAFDAESPHLHAELGYRHLRTFRYLTRVAELVRFHHVNWEHGNGRRFKGVDVPLGSHILQLADRVDALIDRRKPLHWQVNSIINNINHGSGYKFMPGLVKAFLEVAKRDQFWFDASRGNIDEELRSWSEGASVNLDIDGLYGAARLFSHMIDFRSRFTAVHSSGVSTCAYMLAGIMGMSRRDCVYITIAGLLHDLGKLAVPTEILEKKGPLTPDEKKLISAHPYYTYHTLDSLKQIEKINIWASYHHERLDGNGYPFGIPGDMLDLGSRIVAVSDVFTALKEDRPYRTGMEAEQVLSILNGMADEGALDPEIVELVHKHHDPLELVRIKSQDDARRAFREFCLQDHDSHLRPPELVLS
jgi:HD-GYP domain-containing protein (c-di-GMP phosphodiesterase class II)